MTKNAISRRALLAGVAGLAAYGLPVPAAAEYVRTAAQQGTFAIRPRTDWAGDGRLPKSEMDAEDVQTLVVHHTLIPGNGYSQDQVAKLMRDIYDYHTGPEKGWPDIAYNFMVDQFGDVWEARFGSLDGPVIGSASGGNQGFTQLCCFLGDLSGQPPTEAAAASMASLLALLADRYEVDTTPGTTVDLVSRGSTRYASGVAMTLPTLCGHRDVSLTACPGDAGYSFLQNTLPVLVNERRISAAATTTSVAPTTTAAPRTTAAPTTSDAASIDSTTGDALPFDGDEELSLDTVPVTDGPRVLPFLIAGAGLAAAGIGATVVAKRSHEEDDEQENLDIGAILGDAGPPVVTALVRNPVLTPLPSALAGPATADASLASHEGAIASGPVASASPQRVWWAVESSADPWEEIAVQEVVDQVEALAATRPTDLETDRAMWARLDGLLTTSAGASLAALVAARSDAVYILRSAACLVIVDRPDGVLKRDESADALRIERGDVRSIAVHFGDESIYPDIEVTAG